jgi:glyoxylase I family protein
LVFLVLRRRCDWDADARDRCRGAKALRGAKEAVMIPCGDIHHLRLTVTDVQRSREFYTTLLGFQVVVESPPPDDPAADEVFKVLFGGVVMARGNLIMGLRPMAPPADRFHPDRAGLDHLSFGVPARADLEQAMQLFDQHGVTHGEITRLPSFGIDVLSFEDPDGIQLELTAPVPVPADG